MIFSVRRELLDLTHTTHTHLCLLENQKSASLMAHFTRLEYSVVRRREGGGVFFIVSRGISAVMMFNGYLSPGQRKEEPG